jgi:hypothetical protein
MDASITSDAWFLTLVLVGLPFLCLVLATRVL